MRTTDRLALVGLAIPGMMAAGCSHDWTIGSAQEATTAASATPAPPDGGDTSGPRKATAAGVDAGAHLDAAARPPGTDAGTRPPPERAADGEPCAVASERSAECESGLCALQFGKRVRPGLFCTRACDHPFERDPDCDEPDFTGICGAGGTCVVE